MGLTFQPPRGNLLGSFQPLLLLLLCRAACSRDTFQSTLPISVALVAIIVNFPSCPTRTKDCILLSPCNPISHSGIAAVHRRHRSSFQTSPSARTKSPPRRPQHRHRRRNNNFFPRHHLALQAQHPKLSSSHVQHQPRNSPFQHHSRDQPPLPSFSPFPQPRSSLHHHPAPHAQPS